MKYDRNKREVIFAISLMAIVAMFLISALNISRYNEENFEKTFTGTELFVSEDPHTADVSIIAVPRGSTWTKVFDIYDEGLTEHNYQAYTYDFTVSNNTDDEVDDFSFKLIFGKDVFLSSGWNGSIEIHQNVNDKEIVSLIPDLREFVPADHPLETVVFDGETLIPLKEGDYIIYTPSSSMNAMEIPIAPREGTTPGFIMYVAIGENLDESVLELKYSFNRKLSSDPLFWIGTVAAVIWTIGRIVYAITSAQIKKYNERHERDNEIINESIETFTNFIDAKDPYTNGHSKRVAKYTRMIAEKLGFEGEELDRIYYVALLHDCGKIGVPDNILTKPGKLTDEEFQVIKSHTVRGGEILHAFKSLENVDEGARYHHERYDGRGYPEGLAGEDIPFIARMICVADSFDAMNTNRVYRNKLSKEKVIEEIENNKGKQFDPAIADVMLRMIRTGEISVGEENQQKQTPEKQAE